MSDLRVNIQGARGRTQVEFQIAASPTEITALVGPSGSGKTSVLRMIAGLDRPQRGQITLGDSIWFDAAKNIDISVPCRAAGLMFQDYALFAHMTVAENIGYGVPRRDRSRFVSQWLTRMELSDCAQQYPSQLSGGQCQRTAFARTLAARPRLLLLDEPFSALDMALRRHLYGELRAAVLDLECTVIIVSHDLGEIRELADGIIVMESGQVLAQGATASMIAAPPTHVVAQLLGWCARNSNGCSTEDGTNCGVCGWPQTAREKTVMLRHVDCSLTI